MNVTLPDGATVVVPDGLKTMPLDRLVANPRNTRKHPKSQIRQIADSIRAYGFNNPILVDSKKAANVKAGHGRMEAAKLLGMAAVPFVELKHLTPEQQRAFAIVDNKAHDNSEFDHDLLAAELLDLRAASVDIAALGFSESELKVILPMEGQGGGAGPQLLTYIDVTIAEPRTKVAAGDVWLLDKRHVLLCANVMTDFAAWMPYLEGGNKVFVPYPGPFVPFSEKAAKLDLVMVQPDPYIAGHMLDRWMEVKGKKAAKRVAQ